MIVVVVRIQGPNVNGSCQADSVGKGKYESKVKLLNLYYPFSSKENTMSLIVAGRKNTEIVCHAPG